MNTHIINIGDELLIGQVVNTNASWMAEHLNLNNINVSNISVVSDEKNAIREQLDKSISEAEVVLITGGLGPTKDDITKTVLCEYFGAKLITHIPTLEQVKNYFAKRGMEFTLLNRAQALVPDNCEVILNEVGTAPCMWFNHKGKIIVSMAGVPFEMKWLMEHHIIPMLKKHLGTEQIMHKTILTFGIGESFLADRIATWEDALPENIHLAYLPEAGKVRLRLSAYGKNHENLANAINEQIEKLKPYIPNHIYGYDNDLITEVIGNILRKKGKTIATAESCTGGLIGQKITQIQGASDYFEGSIVSYSNRVKIGGLNVNPGTLERYGAVSRETAIEMARGCLSNFAVDYSIAVTGFSGPEGGTDTKPVGTVYIAIASRSEVHCSKYNFSTTRTVHQERTANQALFDMWQLLNEE